MESIINWCSIDWNTVQWEDLFSFGEFKWKLGQTPFSHFQIPVIASILYLITLFGLQNYMRERKSYSLKFVSLLHNAFLTLLSICMFVGTIHGAYLKYETQGFWAGLVCEQDRDPMKGHLFYWSYIFYLSKYYELIDSYLLVLKKKPLLFLHVFHHVIMPFVCWAGLEGKWAMALWSSALWNSFVHILMYYYYFVSSLGYNPWWKKHLTGLQIFQFMNGLFYTWIFFYYYFSGITFSSDGHYNSLSFKQGCTGDLGTILFMSSVNTSFLLLFCKWYLDNYTQRQSKKGGQEIVAGIEAEDKKRQ